MSYANYDDVVEQLRGAGLLVELPLQLARGDKSVRCKTEGGGREKRGWYRLYDWKMDTGTLMLVGSFGIFQGDDAGCMKIELTKQCEECHRDIALKENTCPHCGSKKLKSRELTPEQKAAFKARMVEQQKRAKAERDQEIEHASRWASAVWKAGREALPNEHDYLVRKQLAGTGGARIFESNDGIMLADADKEDYQYLATFHGALVIPLCDQNGKVFGLQFILSKEKHKEIITRTGRDKCYWPAGMGAEGHYWMLGGIPTKLCLVAEGFATGMSLHEATGHPVAVAFAANNIGPVATSLKKHYRNRVKQLFCADDDWLQKCKSCNAYTTVESSLCIHCGSEHSKGNAGVSRSSDSALAVSGAWVKPEFTTDRPTDRKGPTDFNDLHCAEGIQIVRAQIEAKLIELAWTVTTHALAITAPRAGILVQGGGERAALKSMLTLDEAVERFALVFGSKGAMFDFQEHILVPKSDVLDIIPEHGWRDMRPLKRVVRLDEVGFDPAETDKRITCNLWGGWPTTPKKGNCECLLSLLEYLCNEEVEHHSVFAWVMRWLAYPIQHPGAKMRTSLVFHGPQGAGKNLFFEAVMVIYGEYGRIVDQSAIEDPFNDWASKKLFLIADEVVARGELFHVKNKLKSLITGEWIRINTKMVSAHDEKNHVNFVFQSNESQPLVLEKDDRRYAVIHTPEKLDKSFYQQVSDEINAGGIAALHHHLLNLELGDFNEYTEPPMTRAKRDLIDVSKDSVQMFVDEWVSGRLDLPVGPVGSSELYEAYCWFCRVNGESRPRASRQFIGAVKHQPRWEYGEENRFDGSKRVVRGTVTPPHKILEIHKTVRDESVNKASWLTTHCTNFKNALELLK